MTIQPTANRTAHRARGVLLIIVLIAAGLRFYSIDFGLPQMYHPDEPTVAISQRMFKTGDLNPKFFNYPTLFLYINALAYVPYYEIGRMLGEFESTDDLAAPEMLGLGTGLIRTPGIIILGRSLTAITGILCVIVIYFAGKRLHGQVAGLLAALLLALAPTHVLESHYITANIYVSFFALLTAWAALNIYYRDAWRDYVLAGIAAGLVVASKYNGGLIFIMVAAAHFLRTGWSGFKSPKIYLALLLMPLAFVLASPYVVLDFASFWYDMRFEAAHYAAGHAGMEGDALSWYLVYFWNSGGLIAPLALGATLFALYRRAWPVIAIAVFPLAYFAFISSFAVRNARTALLAEPFFYLLAAWFLVELWQVMGQWLGDRRARFGRYALILVTLFIILWPIRTTARGLNELGQVNSRATARVWIAENLPQGAKIGIESYAPYVDPGQFDVVAFNGVIDYEYSWYIENEFDYLVLSQGAYQRFFADPVRYAAQVTQYNRWFNDLELVKLFSDGGYEVRIYALPPQ